MTSFYAVSALSIHFRPSEHTLGKPSERKGSYYLCMIFSVVPRLLIKADRGQNEYLSNEVDIERASDVGDDYDDDIDEDYDEPIEDEIGRCTRLYQFSVI